MNINSDLDYFMSIDISNPKFFPILLTELEFCPFRHIDQMTISFNNPISIISGTNRSGKSTILMALACSHLNFQKRNPKNGKLERHTWSSLVKFTNHDMQKSDWTYFITYKKGTTTEKRRGQRKNSTKKWNGIGKKESQYSLRDVIFIDLDRIVPARFFGEKIYSLSKSSTLKSISATHTADIEKYMSYILEENFVINKIAEHLDKDIFKYNNSNEYSSYNAASGEEVLLKIIIDIVEATPKSLILIDEIEMGLHPKIQRRLLDVIRNVSRQTQKQFIITTHSGTVLDSVCPQSRIFIEKSPTGDFKAIHDISVNAALSKMDSKSFPLVDIYCEDNEAKKIIEKGITEVEKCYSINNFSELINIIISGSAENTFRNFNSHMRTYNQKKVKTGYILPNVLKNF
jgi:predicted ATPase